jgi:hypothetical protein
MEMSGQLQVYLRGKSPQLGGSQSRPGRYGQAKNFAPAGNATTAVQPVAKALFTSKRVGTKIWLISYEQTWYLPKINQDYNVLSSLTHTMARILG